MNLGISINLQSELVRFVILLVLVFYMIRHTAIFFLRWRGHVCLGGSWSGKAAAGCADNLPVCKDPPGGRLSGDAAAKPVLDVLDNAGDRIERVNDRAHPNHLLFVDHAVAHDLDQITGDLFHVLRRAQKF